MAGAALQSAHRFEMAKKASKGHSTLSPSTAQSRPKMGGRPKQPEVHDVTSPSKPTLKGTEVNRTVYKPNVHGLKVGAGQMSSKNLVRPPYLAKGGVQTPPAHFRGSSIGSRKVSSGESSGLLSVGSGSLGGLNEGQTNVQKPLVQ
jgi:hypothetical protein